MTGLFFMSFLMFFGGVDSGFEGFFILFTVSLFDDCTYIQCQHGPKGGFLEAKPSTQAKHAASKLLVALVCWLMFLP